LGNQQALAALKRGEPPTDIARAANAGLSEFLAARQKALIYER
jgi:hypothetical protein